MPNYCKYYKQKKQVSYDSGTTWQDVIPYEYQQGSLYEEGATDCGYIGRITRWLNSGTTCDNFNKYNKQIEQESYDGINWSNTGNERKGSVIEYYSEDCGYEFTGKILIRYSDNKVYTKDCDSYSSLSSGETRPSGYDLKKATSVILGDCVTSIGDWTFTKPGDMQPYGEYFNSLSSITMSDNVTYIGKHVFGSPVKKINSDINGVCNIPSGVTHIGNSAFNGCEYFTTINVPSGVTYFSDAIFFACHNLRSITIPSGVTYIGDYAFSNCHNLPSIDIPNNVTSIGDVAFAGCSGLTNVAIGSGVRSIGDGAFYYCSILTSITCLAATPPELGSSVFNNTNDYFIIYVPSGSVNAYKTATGWSTYASRIQAIQT